LEKGAQSALQAAGGDCGVGEQVLSGYFGGR
jgi:hypothetical protein